MVPAGAPRLATLNGGPSDSGWTKSASAGCRVSVVSPKKPNGCPKPTTRSLQTDVAVPTPPSVMSPYDSEPARLPPATIVSGAAPEPAAAAEPIA